MPANPLSKRIQHEAYNLVWWQLLGVVALALFVLIGWGSKNALSVFAGGMSYGLPNLVFVWRVFRFAGANQMNQFVAAFLMGEAIKLVLSGVLFLFIVKYLPVSLLSTLVGFIAAIILFWIVCMWYFSKQSTQQGVAR